MITIADQIIGYGPIIAIKELKLSAGMQILMELDTMRMLVIDHLDINPDYAWTMFADYEVACRKHGINPDEWEGLHD